MPTYEYRCTRCNLEFEEFKSMSAPRRQRCPECRGKVERLISGGLGIVFRGSGFYATDSRGSNGVGDRDKTESSGANNTNNATKDKA